MNLMFWKNNAISEGDENDLLEKTHHREPSRRSIELDHQANVSDDTRGESEANNKKKPSRRLIIGAALGVIILPLIVVAAWSKFRSSQKNDSVTLDTADLSRPASPSESSVNKLPSIKLPPIKIPKIDLPPIEITPIQSSNDINKLKGESVRQHAHSVTITKQVEEAPIRVETQKNQNSVEQARAAELRKIKEQEAANAYRMKVEEAKVREEALKKIEGEEKARKEALKNEEAKKLAMAEALKKQSRKQPPPTSTAGIKSKGATSVTANGELAVDSGNPKAAAQSLREVIEAMNAATQSAPKKSAK